MKKRYPNLFLVGAPKCGTTSLAYYLAQHPDIFVPNWKEPFYFGLDLTKRGPHPANDADYLMLYQCWSTEKYALDASTSYFYSQSAALEIHSTVPEATILVMVRNPVDAAYSMYCENRFQGVEPLHRFEDALAAESARAHAGQPPVRGILEQLLYLRIYSYVDNIQRFLTTFGHDRVHILVLDDFRTDSRAAFVRLISALGLETSFAERIDFALKNPAKIPRSLGLSRLAHAPPIWMGRMAGLFLSKQQRRQVRKWIYNINTVPSQNPALSPDTRRQLTKQLTPDVEALSRLVNRDLTHWLRTDE